MDVIPGILVACELLLGVFLLLTITGRGLAPKIAAWATIVFLLAMMFALFLVRRAGIGGDCGCLGPVKLSTDIAMPRNLFLVIILALTAGNLARDTFVVVKGVFLTRAIIIAITLFTVVGAVIPFLAAKRSRERVIIASRGRMILQVSSHCPICHELIADIRSRNDLIEKVAFLGSVGSDELPKGALNVVGAVGYAPVSPALLVIRKGRIVQQYFGGPDIRRLLGLERKQISAIERQNRSNFHQNLISKSF